MSDPELTNCARKLWDKICDEHRKNQGYIMDGDKELRFSITTSVKEGSKNYNRFLEEKERVVDYLKRNGGPSLERYIQLCQKPIKVEKKRRRSEEDDIIDDWEGMTKLGKEEFVPTYIFPSETELLSSIQSKFVASAVNKDITHFKVLQEYIQKQIDTLHSLVREVNAEINEFEWQS